eukprot:1153814-Pelagomonas_calceolata.AAC.5
MAQDMRKGHAPRHEEGHPACRLLQLWAVNMSCAEELLGGAACIRRAGGVEVGWAGLGCACTKNTPPGPVVPPV